jgi:hypothetical protein
MEIALQHRVHDPYRGCPNGKKNKILEKQSTNTKMGECAAPVAHSARQLLKKASAAEGSQVRILVSRHKEAVSKVNLRRPLIYDIFHMW